MRKLLLLIAGFSLCIVGINSQRPGQRPPGGPGQPGQGPPGQGPGGQQFQSPCLQDFDKGFRKCFKDNGGFDLEVIFSLVTNGSSGPLPQNANRQQLVQRLCQSRGNINTCTKPIPQNVKQQCDQRESMMMESTIQSTGQATATLCGVEPEMPPCLKKFDTKFRSCMSQQQLNPENYFKLLANTTEGTGMTIDQLRNRTCSKTVQQKIVQCASSSLQSLSQECTQQEQFMVGQTLQNMMAQYQGVCTGQGIIGPGRPPSPCLEKFERELDECTLNTMKATVPEIMTLLTKGQVPPGKDMRELNKSICANFHDFEKCGKKAVLGSKCKGRDLLISEGTFANMIITVGAYCHDTSVPGACMLTLQQQFTKCFTKNNLDPAIYFSNITAHKGALLGPTRPLANDYCAKRHDLYTCMTKVMHQCPGAEQTMTLTGFDITSMERAVGILCDDIDEYLIGLKCFESPSNKAGQCIENMGRAITTMSAQQMAKGLSMDGFFKDFCDIRVDHVSCDTEAWPTCDPKAIQLKTKFECHLLPVRCHDINEDKISKVCPEDARVKPHTCIDDVKMNIGSCLMPYNIDANAFIVNITHDRSNILGSRASAEKFCSSRISVFKCLRRTISACHGASELLAYWGHQQDLLKESLGILCNNLDSYVAGQQCAAKSQSKIDACQRKTEMRMTELIKRNPISQMTSSAYFASFCEARLEHLQCDIDAVKGSCDKGTLGYKTQFECSLIQDRCQGLQRSRYNSICNKNNYAVSDRSPSAGRPLNTASGQSNGQTDGKNGASSGAKYSIIGTTVATLVSFLVTMF